MPFFTRRYRSFPLVLALAAMLMMGCATSHPSSSSQSSVPPASADVASSFPNEQIPYEAIDRRDFVDAGVRVRTTEGNRVSVEVAERDTLVWFEDAQTGRFTRAFLRRNNTIYVLTQETDYLRGSPSQSVAYRLFMKAWRQADATGRSVTTPSYATGQ